MKKLSVALLLIAMAGAVTIISCESNAKANEGAGTENPDKFTAEQVKRGEYLVNAIGCDDCHSPKNMGPNGPEIDTTRRLSGRRSDLPLPKADTGALKSWALFAPDLTAAAGPWGMSFSANITSDESGIGNWSFSQFKKAIREGKLKGMDNTRPLLPPMPWTQYRNFNDEDLMSIFAFLKSTKPVRNIVPAPVAPNKL